MNKNLLSVVLIGFSTILSAQCTTAENGQYPETVYTPICIGEDEKIIDGGYTSEYSLVAVSKDVEYDFSNKNFGSLYGYVTITDELGEEVLAHGSEKVTWISDSDRIVRFYTHGNNCTTDWDAFVDRIVKCKQVDRTEYCQPNLVCSDGAVIESISVGGFTNVTTCSENGFSDNTSKIITLQKGLDYQLNVKIGYGWFQQSVSMWVDYNSNFLFDEDEFTYIGEQNDGPGTVSKTIQIPDNIPDGDYRVRFRLATTPKANATWNKSCDISDTYGETEDYTLRVVTNLGIDDLQNINIQLSPNPVKDFLTIHTKNSIEYVKIVASDGKLIITDYNNTKKLDLSNLPKGVYIVKIKESNQNLTTKKIIKN